MSDLVFNVQAKSESAARTVVKARNFEIIVDEPPQLGGTDLGANPVEYVLAALSGCLNVVSHLVAQELGFTLRGVEINITGSINPEKLFGQETTGRAGYKSIEAEIIPDTDADDATLAKWLKEIEARCPVSDNLTNATPVNISIKQNVLL